MIVEYLFSSPKGDIPITPDDLRTSFKITPSENHPFLTLGDYFKAIEEFVTKHCAKSPASTRQLDPQRKAWRLVPFGQCGVFL
jgi:hypothetical protein